MTILIITLLTFAALACLCALAIMGHAIVEYCTKVTVIRVDMAPLPGSDWGVRL